MTTSIRLAPPFWRHDAYTLRRLAEAVDAAAGSALASFANTGVQPCVIDLGAGDAPYRPLFEDRGARYVTCDIGVPEGGTTVRLEPGRPVPLPDASAQLVVSFQVLEHVWDIDWYLGEARRLLAPNGLVLLSTHGTWLYHPHPTDFRRWTRPGLLAELEVRGLRPVSVQALVGPLAWTTQFRAFGWHRVLSAVPLFGPLLAALSNSLHHLRMKLEDAITPQAWIDDNASTYLVLAQRSEVTSRTP